MVPRGRRSRHFRRSLLALLMAGVLAATVAAAWVLDAAAGRRRRRGAEIVAHIRSRGLEAFWPESTRIDWYLIRGREAPVGWRASARWRSGSGGFAGVALEVYSAGYGREEWALNGDATAGDYAAVSQSRRHGPSATDIAFADGAVTVVRVPGRRARSPAPDNYIPEGMVDLVVRQVADRQTDALFKMVFNERENRHKAVDYGAMRIRDVGPSRAGGRKVGISATRGGGELDRVYEFDANGRVVAVACGEGVRWIAATAEEVEGIFPTAGQRLARFLPGGL